MAARRTEEPPKRLRRARFRPRGSSVAAGLLASSLLAVPAAAHAQSADREEAEQPRPPTIFDLDHRVENPHDLLPLEQNFQDRWRRIWGALGMRYHLYPSQQTGPVRWPPRLYAGGMNYSLWRHPITGWPEF